MAEGGARPIELRLYVAGSTAHSSRAIRLLKQMCSEHGEVDCRVEVVDIYQQLELAQEDNVTAVPTVVRRLPAPVCRLTGDLSNRERMHRLLAVRSGNE